MRRLRRPGSGRRRGARCCSETRALRWPARLRRAPARLMACAVVVAVAPGEWRARGSGRTGAGSRVPAEVNSGCGEEGGRCAGGSGFGRAGGGVPRQVCVVVHMGVDACCCSTGITSIQASMPRGSGLYNISCTLPRVLLRDVQSRVQSEACGHRRECNDEPSVVQEAAASHCRRAPSVICVPASHKTSCGSVLAGDSLWVLGTRCERSVLPGKCAAGGRMRIAGCTGNRGAQFTGSGRLGQVTPCKTPWMSDSERSKHQMLRAKPPRNTIWRNPLAPQHDDAQSNGGA